MPGVTPTQEAGDCTASSCDAYTWKNPPHFLRLPAEISVQQMCYASDDTANPFMTVPHIFITNSFSFQNIPGIVVRGTPRTSSSLARLIYMLCLQLMREKKMLLRMLPPFPLSHPVVLITVSYHSQCKQFCTTLKPIPIFLFCCVLKKPHHNAVEVHPVTIKQRPSWLPQKQLANSCIFHPVKSLTGQSQTSAYHKCEILN